MNFSLLYLTLCSTCLPDKMIMNETLTGVPLLLLANKQDIQGCLGVADIKEDFKGSAHKIGHRDCSVMATSALNGSV